VWLLDDPAGDGGNSFGTYRLLRSDGFLVARSQVGNVALNLSLYGHLPGVQATANADEYAWCGVYKREIVDPGALSSGGVVANFAARAPRDVVITFDSNDARRCARFGKTLYVSGGILLQYDGSGLAELNFSTGPYQNPMNDNGVVPGAGLGLSAGSYSYKTTLRAMNAQGEIDRSSSYSTRTINVIATHQTDDGGSTYGYPVSRRAGAKRHDRILAHDGEPVRKHALLSCLVARPFGGES